MAVNFPNDPDTNDTHTHNGLTWKFDGTTWILQTTVQGGATTFTGLTDTPSSHSNNKWLKSNGNDLIWVDEPGTTYELKTNQVSSNVNLKLDAAGAGIDDNVLITAGSNITFSSITDGGFTIAASSGTATISDGDYGDITVSNTGSVWSIDDDTVGPDELKDTTVSPGSYTNTSITVDQQGRITSASTGSATPLTLGASVTDIFDLGGNPVTLSADDPAADRIVFWDDSAGKLTYLSLGTNLSISGTILNASGSGGSGPSTEEIQDIVGAMFSNNTETRISVDYQDGDGTIDLVVDDMTSSAQDVFKNIFVSGQTTVVADNSNDTLTLVAGTNMTITTDASTDSITFNSSGGSGDGDTTYDIATIGNSNQNSMIKLFGTDNNDSAVVITGTGGITVVGNTSGATKGTMLTIDGSGIGGIGDKIQEGDTKAEVVDSGTDGHFFVEVDGTEYFRVQNNGEILFKRTNTNQEGGHLQFEDADGNQSFAIDVYENSSATSVLRIIDQATPTGSTGTERFSVNRSGAFGIGHVAARDFGSEGEVLTSHGSGTPPSWEEVDSGGGPGGSPGGSDGDIQYNDNGSFGGALLHYASSSSGGSLNYANASGTDKVLTGIDSDEFYKIFAKYGSTNTPYGSAGCGLQVRDEGVWIPGSIYNYTGGSGWCGELGELLISGGTGGSTGWSGRANAVDHGQIYVYGAGAFSHSFDVDRFLYFMVIAVGGGGGGGGGNGSVSGGGGGSGGTVIQFGGHSMVGCCPAGASGTVGGVSAGTSSGNGNNGNATTCNFNGGSAYNMTAYGGSAGAGGGSGVSGGGTAGDAACTFGTFSAGVVAHGEHGQPGHSTWIAGAGGCSFFGGANRDKASNTGGAPGGGGHGAALGGSGQGGNAGCVMILEF